MASSTVPSRPAGVDHLVLNVRDIEVSHRFYTEVLGFEQSGVFERSPVPLRFYRGQPGQHHDVGLAELAEPDAVTSAPGWSLQHFAIRYPDRESWLGQIEHLQAVGVKFDYRIDHGISHSVYISDPDGNGIEVLYELPRSVWEGDISAAMNYIKIRPTEGPDALQDDTNYKVFTAQS